jgi:hypothetical protein
VDQEGQIEKPQPNSVRKEPLQVPGMEFVEIDMHNDAEVSFPLQPIRLTYDRFKSSMSSFQATTLKMTKRLFDLPTPLPS